ncbi:MAG: hypothetical protein ACRDRH_24795 [Pseudonocardia sp.]
MADLIPHQRTPVVFGGLRGELTYNDDSFTEVDPDKLPAGSPSKGRSC